MRSKKRIFRQKSLTQFVELYTMVQMVGHPSVPVIPKHAIFGVQSAWAAAYRADPVPSVHYQGRWALQNADSIYQVQNYLVLA